MSIAERLAAGDLNFLGMPHATVNEEPLADKPRWKRSGSHWKEGNYKLRYRAHDNGRINVANLANHKLVVEIVGTDEQIDVTHVKSGKPITLGTLKEFLAAIGRLDQWSRTEGHTVPCRLVVYENNVNEVTRSNTVNVHPPVLPWTGALQAESFTHDAGIHYCGKLSRAYGKFHGRELTQITSPGKLYFTFVGALETSPKYRGFACIGFVANVLDVPVRVAAELDADPEQLNTRSGGAAVAAYLGGSAFEWADDPRAGIGTFQSKDIDVTGDLFDTEDGYVRMGARKLVEFAQSSQGRAGTYIVWTGGHCGMIENGILYECKPSGKGFTPIDTFTEGVESAVRSFTSTELEVVLKRGQKYNVSQVT